MDLPGTAEAKLGCLAFQAGEQLGFEQGFYQHFKSETRDKCLENVCQVLSLYKVQNLCCKLKYHMVVNLFYDYQIHEYQPKFSL